MNTHDIASCGPLADAILALIQASTSSPEQAAAALAISLGIVCAQADVPIHNAVEILLSAEHGLRHDQSLQA